MPVDPNLLFVRLDQLHKLCAQGLDGEPAPTDGNGCYGRLRGRGAENRCGLEICEPRHAPQGGHARVALETRNREVIARLDEIEDQLASVAPALFVPQNDLIFLPYAPAQEHGVARIVVRLCGQPLGLGAQNIVHVAFELAEIAGLAAGARSGTRRFLIANKPFTAASPEDALLLFAARFRPELVKAAAPQSKPSATRIKLPPISEIIDPDPVWSAFVQRQAGAEAQPEQKDTAHAA